MVSVKYPIEVPDKQETPSPHWAKIAHDELMNAGLLLNDHAETLDEPASKGVVFTLVNRIWKELAKR